MLAGIAGLTFYVVSRRRTSGKLLYLDWGGVGEASMTIPFERAQAVLPGPRFETPRPRHTGAYVLLLDYDGVLHRGDAYRTKRGIVSSDPSRIQLFEYSDLLAEILDPYPSVEIVLSTSWVKALGFTRARDALPVKALRDRVVGATYHTKSHDAHIWNDLSRGAQVLSYVKRHRLVKWLAIDDHGDGFEMVSGNLVLCDTDKALGDVGVQTILKAALHDTFLGGSRPRSTPK